MADEPMTERPASGPICPWCSAPLPGAEAESCPACGARLVGEEGVEIPGVTSVYPDLIAAASNPRKLTRTFGSLLVGDDNEIPPPSEAEMPALAPPDREVRREMLRLSMEARLADLQAEAKALESEGHHLDIDEALLAPPREAAMPPAEAGADAPEGAPGTIGEIDPADEAAPGHDDIAAPGPDDTAPGPEEPGARA